jgi:RNA polymerase sigma-70 factor (ECF subfamily)
LNLEQIIQGCQKKDLLAQEQLYRLYAGKMFAVCLKYVPDRDEAQDYLQDAFLLVFDKIKQFEFKGSFDGWIKRVFINHILQQFRKKSYLAVVDENIPETVEVEIDDGISPEFLFQIVQELPERYRMVFNLYVFEEFSHQEIADALNINIGTSKSNLSRAKMILKQKIEDYTGNSKMPQIQ